MMPARAVLALALIATLAACDEGRPPVRGFGSRQIVAGREEQLAFKGATQSLVLYSTGAGAAARYWTLDVDTDEIVERDAEYSGVPFDDGTAPDPNVRFACHWNVVGGARLLVVTDRQTGQETSIAGIDGTPSRCPTESDPTLSAWRRDDAGRLALWTGPFDALAPVALDVAIVPHERLSMRLDATHVLASAPGDPLDALGIYRVDLVTFAVTVVIPAALTDGAWASGTAATGALVSSSVSHGVAPGSALNWARVGDRFFYERTLADGSFAVFFGPNDPPGPRELALFSVDEGIVRERIQLLASPAPLPGAPMLAAWREHDDIGMTRLLHVWQDERRQLVTCPLDTELAFAPIAAATPDRRRVLISPRPADVDLGIPPSWGPVLLVTPEAAAPDGSGACASLATQDAMAAGISPDGTALFWVRKPDVGDESELWAAASDGSGQRLLGRDRIFAPHFVGPSQLQFELRPDLVWLDVNDDPVRMHYIADDVFGTAIDVGRWLVTGYQRSGQDGTGRLGVVNRDTGEARLISPEVVKYTSPDGMPFVTNRRADRPVRVVYQVRGRNPSPQDGLWMATVDETELP